MAEQMKLVLEPKVAEVTDWAKGQPPFIGWWDTRVIYRGFGRLPLVQRRWWSATGWSMPVMLGDSNEDAERAKNYPGQAPWSMMEYRGLVAPPVDGYTWALDAHHRSNLAVASRTRIALVA